MDGSREVSVCFTAYRICRGCLQLRGCVVSLFARRRVFLFSGAMGGVRSVVYWYRCIGGWENVWEVDFWWLWRNW